MKGVIIMQFFSALSGNNELKVLLVLVILDTIFGIFRSLREKKLNSNIGIDGLIRKFGMLISVIFFILIDILIKFNFIRLHS
jgi:toxin secretion/phage lysis holin